MKMSVLITEHQRKALITESIVEDFGKVIKDNYRLAAEILKDSKEQMGVNLQFMMTWGASIGGFVGPLTDFIEGRYPELNSVQVTSILIGIIATFYLDNKKTISIILEKIKEQGLSEYFKEVFNKANELKNSFLSFVESLNLTFHKVTNMMTYTFIIPLVEKLISIAQTGQLDDGDLKQLAMRISSFGLLTVSSIGIVKLVKKMVNRFRNN
jgi:hypothetical protein